MATNKMAERALHPKGIILLENGWQEIQTKGIDEIIAAIDRKEGTGLAEKLQFDREQAVEIYTKVFIMCHQVDPYNWSSALYTRHGQTVQDFLANYLSMSIQHVALQYSHIHANRNFQSMHNHATTVHHMDDDVILTRTERFLSDFLNHWQNFLFYNKWMTNFLRILDRVHAQPNNLPTLSKATVRRFELTIFVPHKHALTAAILDLIRLERDGLGITRSLVTKVASMFRAIDRAYDNNDNENGADRYPRRKCHLEQLEEDFLEDTRLYYATKRDREWRELDSTDYYANAQATLDDEHNKSVEYLHKISSPESTLYGLLRRELFDQASIPPNQQSSCSQYFPGAGLFSNSSSSSRKPRSHGGDDLSFYSNSLHGGSSIHSHSKHSNNNNNVPESAPRRSRRDRDRDRDSRRTRSMSPFKFVMRVSGRSGRKKESQEQPIPKQQQQQEQKQQKQQKQQQQEQKHQEHQRQESVKEGGRDTKSEATTSSKADVSRSSQDDMSEDRKEYPPLLQPEKPKTRGRGLSPRRWAGRRSSLSSATGRRASLSSATRSSSPAVRNSRYRKVPSTVAAADLAAARHSFEEEVPFEI